MTLKPLRFSLAALVGLSCIFAASVTAHAAVVPRLAASLMRDVNVTRAANGLRPLRLDRRLNHAARSHSRDMLAHEYFTHGDFVERMRAFHVLGGRVGENLAWGSGPYGHAAAVLEEWLASPEHRANVLDPRFARIGVGVVRGTFLGKANATVVTADFAGG